ncbi:MAG: nitrilase-related carbon-nitrogen hydrolase [Chlamydiia bacterium]
MTTLKNPPEVPALAYFGLFLVFFFSCWIAIQFYLAARWAQSISRAHCYIPFIALITLFEWHRQWFCCGYNFYTVSSVLLMHPLTMRIFSYVGVFGATFLFLLATLPPLFSPKQVHSYLGSILFFGLLLIPSAAKKGGDATIGVFQTYLDPWGEDLDDYTASFEKILKNIEGVDCLVLSETSIPGKYFNHFPDNDLDQRSADSLRIEKALLNASYFKKMDILVGHIHPLGNNQFHNSVSLIHNGQVVGRNDKMRLLSVMESRWSFLPQVVLDAIDSGDFIAGRKKEALEGKFQYGVHICYDDYFGEECHSLAKQPIDLFVSLHNDIWVSSPSFKQNHFNQSLLRAVEGGIPIVRGANGGFCGYALHSGEYKIVEQTSGLHIFKVPLDRQFTLYPYLKDRFIIGVCFICILCYLRGGKSSILPRVEEEVDENAP